jgi:hypothetical protein
MIMRTDSRFSSMCATIGFLALPLICSAQYTNSATGQTYNNSYSAMLSVTNSMTQNFTTMQRQYLGSISSRTSGSGSSSMSGQPAQAQFPITATDFRGAAVRELPERLVAAMPGATPEQKSTVQTLCNQLLAEYEKTNRRNNIAAALTYSVRISLEIESGRRLSPAEAAAAFRSFNNGLAATAEFRTMTPDQKQILYESSILTGGIAAVLYLQGRQQNNPAMQAQGRQIAQSFLKQWAGSAQ